MKWKLLLTLTFWAGCTPTGGDDVGEQSFNERYLTAYCERLSTCEGEIVAWYMEEYGLSDPAAQDRYYNKYDTECTSAIDPSADTCEIDEYRAQQCFDYMESYNCISLEQGGAPAECGMVCTSRAR